MGGSRAAEGPPVTRRPWNIRPERGLRDRRGNPLKRGPHRAGRCLRRVPHGEGFARWARMLGAQIEYVLEEQDVPAAELAAACGVWESTVQRWLTGAKPPTTRRLKQIADALGVLVLDLMPRAS